MTCWLASLGEVFLACSTVDKPIDSVIPGLLVEVDTFPFVYAWIEGHSYVKSARMLAFYSRSSA